MRELQHALAVAKFLDDEADKEDDIFDAIDPLKTILESTSALIILENDGTVVQLVHRSLEDYLHRDETRKTWFPMADVEIVKACIRPSAGTLSRRAFSVQDFKVPFSPARLAVLG